jgi:hypothetical protein
MTGRVSLEMCETWGRDFLTRLDKRVDKCLAFLRQFLSGNVKVTTGISRVAFVCPSHFKAPETVNERIVISKGHLFSVGADIGRGANSSRVLRELGSRAAYRRTLTRRRWLHAHRRGIQCDEQDARAGGPLARFASAPPRDTARGRGQRRSGDGVRAGRTGREIARDGFEGAAPVRPGE